jgi:hypothetical protein
MRVIELRDGPSLVLEAITKLKVGRELRWQDLDGDVRSRRVSRAL